MRQARKIEQCLNSGMQTRTAFLGRIARGGAVSKHLPVHGLEYLSALACKSDPRGRTKWYGTYTDEQYQAQRQSEERARWAAGVRTLTGNQSQLSWEGSLLEPPALLDGVTVVIISPRKPVTVGTVARACGSFECEDLRIVMPRQESYITRRHAKSASKGAQYILYRAAHYDSIAQATADCEVRIAFTRWSQASSPHVFKVDISSLADHPAVHDVITQPLKDTGTRRAPRAATATADNGAGAGAGAGGSDISSPPAPLPSRPTPATWSAATAAAAEAAEVRLAAASVLSSSGGSGDDENEEPPPAQQPSQQQQQQQQREALATSSGWASTGCDSRGTDSYPSSGYERNPAATSSFQQPHHHHCHHAEHQHKLQPASSSDGSSSMSNAAVVAGAGAEGPTGRRPPRVALVFGREELGMSDEEVDSCEVCCSIPIGRLQESLSLSHAVSIALCTLYQARLNHLTGAAGEQAIAAAAAAGEAQLLLQPHLHVATAAATATAGATIASRGEGPSLSESVA